MSKKRRKKPKLNISKKLSSIKIVNFKVPSNFSFLLNKEEFLTFINKLKDYEYKNSKLYQIHIDLNNVTYLDQLSITILLSVLDDLIKGNVKFVGNVPLNIYANKLLDNSGFFEHVKDLETGQYSKISRSKNFILKIGENSIDSKMLGDLIKDCVYKISGEESHFRKLYTILMEIIPNTIEHAYSKRNNVKKSWFLGIEYVVKDNKVLFTFVDNGFGILNTIYKLPEQRTQELIQLTSEPLILEGVFNKEYNSRLKDENRNKGLPIVKSIFNEGFIKNLKVFSNKAGISFKESEYIKLKNEFKGTLFYFEIDIECINKNNEERNKSKSS